MSENETITPEVITAHLVTVSKDRKAITNSLMVAEFFDKRHDNVMRDIEELKKRGLLNFEESNYVNKQNKRQPMYEMDRTGFTLLAMGFTGEKALDFKIRYIQAFDTMESELMKQRDEGQRRINGIMSRVCGACGNEKPLTEFYRNRSMRDGYAWECKVCSKLIKQKHLAGNIARNMLLSMADGDESLVESDVLEGMKQICDYAMKSEPTILSLIKDNGFPARKMRGVWVTRKSRVDAWIETYMRSLPSNHVQKQEMPPVVSAPVQVHAPHDKSIFETYRRDMMDLVNHYRSMISGYREEIAGYRNELSFYRGLHRGVERDDYAKLTEKARKCLSSLAPLHSGMTRESLVEMAVCMAVDSGRGGRMMDS